ncbi:hypothetical protein RRG08_006009 [Elysia crispata]|uniref:Uncharacterized protein n=1 Tax=Elysia crispata TaxID=231223 RepID=A0AAE0XUY5_9GAST|nr:hypothetical protein RRG08_006009 [Elysia crispata]
MLRRESHLHFISLPSHLKSCTIGDASNIQVGEWIRQTLRCEAGEIAASLHRVTDCESQYGTTILTSAV